MCRRGKEGSIWINSKQTKAAEGRSREGSRESEEGNQRNYKAKASREGQKGASRGKQR
jgi:hypothetical protein